MRIAPQNTASTPPPILRVGAPTSTKRPAITDRMVDTVMTSLVLTLEERLIPAQGVGDTLHIYTRDSDITHDVRRTLEVFEGDMNQAIESIHQFVIDGILGDVPRS